MACIVQPCSAYNCLFTSGCSGVPDLFKLLSSTCPWSIEISYWFVGLFLQSTRSLEYLLFVLLYSCSNRSLFWCATFFGSLFVVRFTFSRYRLLPSEWLNFFCFLPWLSSLCTGLSKLHQEGSASVAETSDLRAKEPLLSFCVFLC